MTLNWFCYQYFCLIFMFCVFILRQKELDIRFRLFAFIGWPKIIQSHQRKNNTSIKACIQLSLIWMMHWIYFLNPILKTDVINSTTKIVTRPLTLACNEVTIRNNKTKSRIAWTEKLLIYPDILILTHIHSLEMLSYLKILEDDTKLID